MWTKNESMVFDKKQQQQSAKPENLTLEKKHLVFC